MSLIALKTNVRLYAGVCPDCGLFLWRSLRHESVKGGVPSVHLRCAECGVISYARPVRSHIVQRDPAWVADTEQVVEWFDENMIGSGADTASRPVAATDGGTS